MGEHWTLIITAPSSYKDTLSAKALTLSMFNINHVFKHLSLFMHSPFRSWYLAGQDQVIMVLAFNDNQIIY